ncbi:tRNA pseudouridine(55) synthase TruB [Actinospongicola halichondriae]|uniref:tRNA pseudouridine(55) synthase TruB n=1 Tax=Actinospongicola halichondriae TaxID=3236844 RepID=UPI003D52971E
MSRTKPSPHNGLVLVDKEPGWTSHDVVAKSRGVLGTRKVGHAGTLDPPATGLLLVGVGSMTRLLRFLTALPKTYVGEIVLGSETDTLDDTGEVTATHDMAGVTLAEVRSAAADLTGDILQIPPMVSAIKIDGKRLHELAREGKEVEREPRPITIHEFTVGEPVDDGVFPIEVTCSSGTYIRTLAADVGTALGGGAHLRNLRRTRAGSHDVSDAHRIDDVIAPDHVLSPAEALRDLPTVVVDQATAVDVGHGKPLERARLGLPDDHDGPWAVQSQDGVLLAVYGPHREGTVKPEVVVAP